MLRTLLICPDDELGRQFGDVLPEMPDLEVSRVLREYPSPEELLRTIRVRKTELLFLCVDDFARAELLAKCVDDLMPGFPVVTVSSREGVEVLHKLMHLGIREHLASPVTLAAVMAVIERVNTRLKTHPVAGLRPSDLYTFLPAKPGVGT